MRSFIVTISALLAGYAAHVNAACTPSASDMTAVEFGYSVQKLLVSYYESVPVNSTFFSALPSDVTSHTDILANAEGLKRQAKLGVDALEELASKGSTNSSRMPMPSCKYNPPKPQNAKAYLMNAQQIESTLCGAFIGLADYVQWPQAAFLMARLSAGHGNHAAYIGSLMKADLYMANSTQLLPAFKPQEVMTPGMGVGHLGQWMNNCTRIPTPPCGRHLKIGPLGSNLTRASSGSMSSTRASTSPVYTGAASTRRAGLGCVLGAMIGAAALL